MARVTLRERIRRKLERLRSALEAELAQERRVRHLKKLATLHRERRRLARAAGPSGKAAAQ